MGDRERERERSSAAQHVPGSACPRPGGERQRVVHDLQPGSPINNIF